jgi:hypothetical protein
MTTMTMMDAAGAADVGAGTAARRLRRVACACAAFALVLAFAPGRAEARRHRGGGGFGGQPGYKTFGIGLILGSPTGLSAELRLTPRTGLDFALGLDTFDDDDGGYLHLDYLIYFAQLYGTSVSVPFYVGFGGVLWDHHRGFDNDDDLHLGLRVPFGVAFALHSVPLQFFFELAVRVMVFDEDDDRYDDDEVDLTGGLGFRIYF